MLAEAFELLVGLVLELCGEFLLGLLWWLVLFPVVWIGSAPFILLLALFRAGPYWLAVSDRFIAVQQFWLEQGPCISFW